MAIIVQIKRIYDCIESKFDEHMEKLESKWDKAHELYRIGSYHHTYDMSATDKLFRNTKSYKPYIKGNYIPQIQLSANDSHVQYNRDYVTFEIPKDADFNIRVCGRSSFKRFSRVWHNETNPMKISGLVQDNRVEAMSNLVQIIVNDTARGGATFAKAYFSDISTKNQCVFIEPDKLGNTAEISAFVDKINAKMDNPGLSIVYLSKVKEEHPDLTKRTVRPKSNIGYYEIGDGFSAVYAIRNSIPERFETDTIVYIPFKQQKPTSDNNDFSNLSSLGDRPDSFANIHQVTLALQKIAHYTGEKMPTVVGLNQNMLRQVGDYDNWIPANEYIEQQFHKQFGKQSQRDKIVKQLTGKLRTNAIVDNVEWPFCTDTTRKIAEQLSQTPELAEVCDIINLLISGNVTTTHLEDLYSMFYEVPGVDYDAEWFNSKFSILSLVENERSWCKIDNEDVTKVVNYIKTCTLNGESK